MTAEERLATYLGDERHIYKGSHALRRRAALADLQSAMEAARREERERCAAVLDASARRHRIMAGMTEDERRWHDGYQTCAEQQAHVIRALDEPTEGGGKNA